MPLFYDNIDSNDTESAKGYDRYYQPNYVRTRHPYRGTRDSEKVNLELGQMRLELYKLYNMIYTSYNNFNAIVSAFYDSSNPIPAEVYGNEVNLLVEYSIEGIDNIAKQIAELNGRLTELEKSNG